jgi:hypothetical protein
LLTACWVKPTVSWKNEDAGGDTWEFEEDLIEDAPDSAPD